MSRFVLTGIVLLIFGAGGAFELATGRYIGVGRISLLAKPTPATVRMLGGSSMIGAVVIAGYILLHR